MCQIETCNCARCELKKVKAELEEIQSAIKDSLLGCVSSKERNVVELSFKTLEEAQNAHRVIFEMREKYFER